MRCKGWGTKMAKNNMKVGEIHSRWRVMLGRVPVSGLVKNLIVTSQPQNWMCSFSSEAAARRFFVRVNAVNQKFKAPKPMYLEHRLVVRLT